MQYKILHESKYVTVIELFDNISKLHSFTTINVYFPPNSDTFRAMFQDLNDIVSKYKSHKLLLTGDFNSTPFEKRIKMNKKFGRSSIKSEKLRDGALDQFLGQNTLTCCNSDLGTSFHKIKHGEIATLIYLTVTNTPTIIHSAKPLKIEPILGTKESRPSSYHLPVESVLRVT